MNMSQMAIRLKIEEQLRKSAQRLGESYSRRFKRPVAIRYTVTVKPPKKYVKRGHD